MSYSRWKRKVEWYYKLSPKQAEFKGAKGNCEQGNCSISLYLYCLDNGKNYSWLEFSLKTEIYTYKGWGGKWPRKRA